IRFISPITQSTSSIHGRRTGRGTACNGASCWRCGWRSEGSRGDALRSRDMVPPRSRQPAAPRLEFEDVTPFLIDMRQVKYPEELDIIRDAAALSDFGQDKYMELVKPGMNVKAFDFEIASLVMQEGGRRFPEERVEVRLMSLSGKYSASPHGTGAGAGETFEKGDGVVNIIIVRLNGLVVENERTLFVGKPREDI